ncbi:right-handed parallel beta-helix repeat-containing protein [Lysobacter sp. 2RAF19]
MADRPGGALISRRSLLARLAGTGTMLALGREAFAKSARKVSVRDFGAHGDGANDDTQAFQQAIDALPDGGTVNVPSGIYRIDPLHSVRLRSGIHLKMARGAELHAIPNAAPRAYVLLVQAVTDVRISGGRIVGDRDRHLGTDGEWGHGIAIYDGVRVVVRDMQISRCWGDGISIGGKKRSRDDLRPSTDIEIANVKFIGNRRQGLTVGRSRRVWVHDCEMADTGGTAPMAGIDVEPDKGDMAKDVRIERCLVRRNLGPGIQVWHDTQDVLIRDCTIEDNRNPGILAVGTQGLSIRGNRIRGNAKVGIALRKQARNVDISGNTFSDNAPGRPRKPTFGTDPRWAHNLEVAEDASLPKVSGDNRLD